MIKQIGFSLLMTLSRPVAAAGSATVALLDEPTKNDQHQSALLAVNNPTLTLTSPAWPDGRSLLPAEIEFPLLDVHFCGESMPLDQADVLSRWKRVFTLFKPQSLRIDALRRPVFSAD